jgi:putative membrane protein
VKRLSWIVTLPVTLVVVVFAVSNRDEVAINLWPTGLDLTIPFFAVVLGVFLAGFLVGAAIMWLSGAKGRARARRLRYRAEELERELVRLQRQADAAKAGASGTPVRPGPPAGPRLAIGNGKSENLPSDLGSR